MILSRNDRPRRNAARALPMMCLVLTTMMAAGACRKQQQQPEEVKYAQPRVAGVVPTGNVSDGILEGLQREMDAASKAHTDAADRVKTVKPLLKCVEQVSLTSWRAHFGYTNSAANDVEIPNSLFNRFWPPPLVRGQPKIFSSGSRDDVVQADFDPRGSTAWVLGSGFVLASNKSTLCPKK
jgi:hypothetical protein